MEQLTRATCFTEQSISMNIKDIYPILFLVRTFVYLYNYLCCYTPCEVYTVLLIIIIIIINMPTREPKQFQKTRRMRPVATSTWFNKHNRLVPIIDGWWYENHLLTGRVISIFKVLGFIK